jgi:hypothetical protein
MTQPSNPSSPTAGNIYMAMAAITRDIDIISKDRKNEQQGFKFRGIDDAYNALHPIFAAHGVFCLPVIESVTQTDAGKTAKGTPITRTMLTMGYRFTASDGSYVEARLPGEGMDSADKGTAKAMSVAHKYLLLQTFLVPTADIIDADSYDPTVMPREELARRREQQAKDATDKDIIAQMIEQHLENAALTESTTEKSRLQGLAAELRCKLAEMERPVAGKEIAQHAENEEPEQPASDPVPGPHPKAEPPPKRMAAEATTDWRTVDFSHKSPKVGSLLYGKTVGDIYASEPGTIVRAKKILGGFMQTMDEIAKKNEAGETVAFAPADMRLYTAVCEAERWLANQPAK